MASLPDGTCPRYLLQGLVIGTSLLVCADLNRVKLLVSKFFFSKKWQNYNCYNNFNSIIVVIWLRKFVSLIPLTLFAYLNYLEYENRRVAHAQMFL